MVEVHCFRAFDIRTGTFKISQSMAQRSAIQRISAAEIIPGTARRVNPMLLDGNGMIRRDHPSFG